MPYLDHIELDAEEQLPPRYFLCCAGAHDSKIAVLPGNVGSTYGRYPKTPEGRAKAIASAWATFGWTPEQWALVKVAVDQTRSQDCECPGDGALCDPCKTWGALTETL